MKTITDYRNEILVTLGDTAGKRYSEAQLDTAVRRTLDRLNQSRPAKETIKVKVAAAEGREAVLNWCPGPDTDILAVRSGSGKQLPAAVCRTAGKTYVTIFSGELPAAGDHLLLEVRVPHTVSGLDNAVNTTVPESLAQTFCTGAAGYAMMIRARSVTEVFGKRPEDTDKMVSQGSALVQEFLEDLGERCLSEGMLSDPWPRHGFPV